MLFTTLITITKSWAFLVCKTNKIPTILQVSISILVFVIYNVKCLIANIPLFYVNIIQKSN